MKNQIKEIDWGMDFGTVKLINLGQNPVAKDYRERHSDYYRSVEMNGISFQFDYAYDRENFSVDWLEGLN
jgi:hypothetical protein